MTTDLSSRDSSTSQQLLSVCQQQVLSLVPADGLLIVAVSGGIDSMVLLHMLHAEPTLRPRLHAAHMNHGLRGDDSAADAEFVNCCCTKLGITLTIEQTTAAELHDSSRGSLEESARNARYDFLLRLAEERSATAVLTAHHADDQCETLLHNLLRGTGISGLQGMQAVRPLSDLVLLARPLLQITRSELTTFATERQIPYVCDSSNQDLSFQRNRLRHQLLPLLQDLAGPAVRQSLLRLSAQAGEAVEFLNQQADDLLQNHLLQCTPDCVRLQISPLQQTSPFLIRHTCVRLWQRQNWPRQRMTAGHWQRLADLISTPGKLSLPGGIQAESARGLLLLTQH